MPDCSKGYGGISHGDKVMAFPRGREDILGIRYRLLVPGKTGPWNHLAVFHIACTFMF